jgi:hypothetical protein
MDVMADDLQGYEFETDDNGKSHICVCLKKIILNAGKYNLSIIVLSKDLKVLCRHDNALTVTVQTHCASGASVIFPAEWTSRIPTN